MATMFQIIQFLDGNGDPYDSGAVYWYEAGTTTPKDTWVDEAESSTAANPVLLDSDGRPDHGSGPDAMWLRGSYKMVLKDSGGNTIITIDNINLYDQLDWTGLTATIADLNSTSTETLLKTSTYTVSISDRGKTILADASGGAFTINLPASATAGNKFKIIIKKIDNSTNAVTIDPAGTEKIDEQTTYVLQDYFDFIESHSDASNWHVVASQIRGTIRSVTSVTTLTLDDNTRVINANANGGAFAVNLPSASVVGKGWSVTVKKTDSSTNAVTVTATGGQTIDGLATSALNTQYFAITVKSDGSNYFIVSEFGDNASGGAYPPGYLSRKGFLIERNNGDLDHDLLFYEGAARGVNDLVNMRIGAGQLTKQIDVGWAEGNNQGGFPTGISLSPNTWYHCFIIGKNDGTTDAGFDTSLTATHLLADATGYVDYLRVSSVQTDGANNMRPFDQEFVGDVRYTLWDQSVISTGLLDRGGAGPSSDVVTVGVPLGVHVKTFGEATYEATTGGDEAAIYAVNQGGLGGDSQMMTMPGVTGIHLNSSYFEVYTNTLQQVRIDQTGGATSKVRYTTRGWEE
jgi:hypothetical protein